MTVVTVPAESAKKRGLKSGNMLTKTVRWRNADVAWDRFPPGIYKQMHYSKLLEDDREILSQVRDFFAETGVRGKNGIDAGCGPNLYPSLSMLPFCSKVTLLDISASNVSWLRRQKWLPDRSWTQFWNVLTEHALYRELRGFRWHLMKAAKVKRGSIFDLPVSQFDIGTMFFAAESLTNDEDEFMKAIHCFVRSLKDGAPFAIACMNLSEGYRVNDADYPAVAIDATRVTQCLETVAEKVSINTIRPRSDLREGYKGMMLATGWAATGV